ncbi:MAG TPA: enoyl-CoA hydratase/isomerase family protein [Candidatus Solibacter sp.]|nr:enoyl-CoA hydratase/isomerase family protein [Candidatus Solibacter sp.]
MSFVGNHVTVYFDIIQSTGAGSARRLAFFADAIMLVQSSRSGHLLHLTINRPEKRNALNGELCRELCDGIGAGDADPDVHAILLTANGKSFCAGMDLAEIAGALTEEADAAEIDTVQERLFTMGGRVLTPIIAGVQGAALAGGTGLVANCHIVVAGEAATFGLTEVRLGLWPFLVLRACAAAMGERRTMELSLTGRIFSADEARSFGLVHEVAADAQARAAEIAQQVAASSAFAIRKGMSAVHQSVGKSWQGAGELARQARKEVFHSPEFREGIRKWAKRES